MAQEGFKRKLAGILIADVKGYSRLMEEDEEATIRTITDYRNIITEQVNQHEGRVVDSPGDNVLAEFASVVDALKCATQIQKEIAEQNVSLPENRKMEFRIGVNLGDVAEEGNRIYGDGVNVAARIESLAEPGGICISHTVYDQVKKKLRFGYEYLGEHAVKNIEEPVRVYRVLTAPEHSGRVIGEKKPDGKKWRRLAVTAVVLLIAVAGGLTAWNFYLHQSKTIEPASLDKMAYPLPDKPSIAVMPFNNLSGDPEQEYIADGITENIITTLSYISELFVIARNSTYTYKGKPVKVQQIAEDLGVRYVLEGSVQKSGDTFRVTAQLLDALSGHHLFADRYDRDLKDFFSLLDEITQKIIIEVQVKITDGERARMFFPVHSMEAWEYAIKGAALHRKITREDNVKAREHLEKAIKIEPEYTFALAALAHVHYTDARYGFSESRANSFKESVELVKKTLSLDEDHPLANSVMGDIYLAQKQYDKAIAATEKAVNLSPNDSMLYMMLAGKLTYAGKYDEAITPSEVGMRLSPYPPAWYYLALGRTYRDAGRYEQALTAYQHALARANKGEMNPEDVYIWLAMIYIYLGREAEARSYAEAFLKIVPKPGSFDPLRKMMPYKDPARTEQHVEAIRKALNLAGWKEPES